MHDLRVKTHGTPGPPGRVRRGRLVDVLRETALTITDECQSPLGQDGRRAVSVSGKYMPAARAMWVIHNGDPGQAYVLHNCDNGHLGCVNLRHLYLGDHGQNMRDLAKTGTRHKLTVEDVKAIRARRESGEVLRTIAADFGVSITAVHRAANGGTWSWAD